MKDNLGLILGALSVLIAFPILLWVAREPAPQGQNPNPDVYAPKTAALSNAPDVTLGWSANSEPGLVGYKIYYKTESRTPPYDGKGLAEGDSPIVVPLEKFENSNTPEITLHGLNKDQTYFFTITAYDNKGRESGFSEGVVFKSPKEE